MSNKGNILLVILVVGLLAASIGGYIWWQKQQQAGQPFPFGGNYYKQIPDSKPKDETANWKAYTDAKRGFSIQYPPELNVYDVSMKTYTDIEISDRLSSNTKGVVGQNLKEIVDVAIIPNPVSIGGGKTVTKIEDYGYSPERLIIFDFQGYRAGKVTADLTDLNYPIPERKTTIIFMRGTTLWKLEGSVFADKVNKNEEIDQILSTFKFLDQNNLQGAACGGWDTSGRVICGCSSGQITETSCPPGTTCDSGTYYCQGACGVCCYKGIGINPKYPTCN